MAEDKGKETTQRNIPDKKDADAGFLVRQAARRLGAKAPKDKALVWKARTGEPDEAAFMDAVVLSKEPAGIKRDLTTYVYMNDYPSVTIEGKKIFVSTGLLDALPNPDHVKARLTSEMVKFKQAPLNNLAMLLGTAMASSLPFVSLMFLDSKKNPLQLLAGAAAGLAAIGSIPASWFFVRSQHDQADKKAAEIIGTDALIDSIKAVDACEKTLKEEGKISWVHRIGNSLNHMVEGARSAEGRIQRLESRAGKSNAEQVREEQSTSTQQRR